MHGSLRRIIRSPWFLHRQPRGDRAHSGSLFNLIRSWGPMISFGGGIHCRANPVFSRSTLPAAGVIGAQPRISAEPKQNRGLFPVPNFSPFRSVN